MKPVVDRLAKQYANKVEIRMFNANDAATQQLASQFDIQYVPTFVFADATGKVVDKVVGGMTEAALTAKLDAMK
jgi:thiol-disulfide isomerase/thioredoxin